MDDMNSTVWKELRNSTPPSNTLILFARMENGVPVRVESGIFTPPILPNYWSTHWMPIPTTIEGRDAVDPIVGRRVAVLTSKDLCDSESPVVIMGVVPVSTGLPGTWARKSSMHVRRGYEICIVTHDINSMMRY